MIRDYFADLELDIHAGGQEIKRAYRRLARRFHPDLNPGDRFAEASFRQIRAAYEYLSDETRADQLRIYLQKSARQARPKKWQANDIFGYGDQAPDARNILDIHTIAELTDEDLQKGYYELSLLIEEPCHECGGDGGPESSIKRTCKHCAGLAYRLIQRGAFRWKKTCEPCHGKGFEVINACPACQGKGKKKQTRKLQLRIPESLQATRYPEWGHIAYNREQKRGDLWVHWRIQK